MTIDDALDSLVPSSPWKPDWIDALERAGELDQRRRQPWARRRRILALAVIGLLLSALVALVAEGANWLFAL